MGEPVTLCAQNVVVEVTLDLNDLLGLFSSLSLIVALCFVSPSVTLQIELKYIEVMELLIFIFYF